MKYDLQQAITILKRTPLLLELQLKGLSDDWILTNEGGETWSPFDVMGHLLHGEKTDWMARVEIALSDGENRAFTPFDRFAQFHEGKGKTMDQLLAEFKAAREKNISLLLSKNITEADFNRTAIHPAFGTVTLKNLLSTWVVHDLNHMSQINRVMGFQYKGEVGPWVEYLRILK